MDMKLLKRKSKIVDEKTSSRIATVSFYFIDLFFIPKNGKVVSGMKYICTLIALLFPFLSKADITYPTNNTVWYPGDKITLTWNPENTLGLTVVILLSSSENPFPSGELNHHWVYIAFDPIDNRLGKYDWVVPDDLTDDRTYRILIFGNVPNQTLVSEVFHVRFDKRRTAEPLLTIKKSRDVVLKWSGIYGRTYLIEESDDLQNWYPREMVFANDEMIEVSAPITAGPHYFRVHDATTN